MIKVALWLHLLCVSVWVGGQIVLAFLVPTIRRKEADPQMARQVLTAVAQRFQLVAWTALIGALFTGIWMLLLLNVSETGPFAERLFLKLVVVVLAALAVAGHAFWIGPQLRRLPIDEERTQRQRQLRILSGLLAAFGLIFSILAVYMGVRLALG